MRRAILLIALLACAGCSDGCGNSIVSRSASPDGRRVAVLFQRDCGATTGFSTQISILPAGEQALEAGNAFRADDGHGAARAGDWGGPWAEMAWLSADHLRIRYAARSRLLRQRDEVDGVMVTYRQAED
jgi:hypothetical protein